MAEEVDGSVEADRGVRVGLSSKRSLRDEKSTENKHLKIRETIDYSADHRGEKCDGYYSYDLVGRGHSLRLFHGVVGVDRFLVGL